MDSKGIIMGPTVMSGNSDMVDMTKIKSDGSNRSKKSRHEGNFGNDDRSRPSEGGQTVMEGKEKPFRLGDDQEILLEKLFALQRERSFIEEQEASPREVSFVSNVNGQVPTFGVEVNEESSKNSSDSSTQAGFFPTKVGHCVTEAITQSPNITTKLTTSTSNSHSDTAEENKKEEIEVVNIESAHESKPCSVKEYNNSRWHITSSLVASVVSALVVVCWSVLRGVVPCGGINESDFLNQKNAVTTVDAVIRSAVPDATYYSLVECGFFQNPCVGWVVVSWIFSPDCSNPRRYSLLLLKLASIIVLVLLARYLVLFNLIATFEYWPYVREAFTMINLFVLVGVVLASEGRKPAMNGAASDVSKQVAAIIIVKMYVVITLGIWGFHYYLTRVFPFGQGLSYKLAGTIPESYHLLREFVVATIEVLMIWLFAYVLMPVWGKVTAMSVTRAVVHLPGKLHEKECQRRIVLVNYWIELLQTLCGRLLYLQMSQVLVLVFIVVCDLAHNMIQFGARYSEAAVLFYFQSRHGDGEDHLFLLNTDDIDGDGEDDGESFFDDVEEDETDEQLRVTKTLSQNTVANLEHSRRAVNSKGHYVLKVKKSEINSREKNQLQKELLYVACRFADMTRNPIATHWQEHVVYAPYGCTESEMTSVRLHVDSVELVVDNVPADWQEFLFMEHAQAHSYVERTPLLQNFDSVPKKEEVSTGDEIEGQSPSSTRVPDTENGSSIKPSPDASKLEEIKKQELLKVILHTNEMRQKRSGSFNFPADDDLGKLLDSVHPSRNNSFVGDQTDAAKLASALTKQKLTDPQSDSNSSGSDESSEEEIAAISNLVEPVSITPITVTVTDAAEVERRSKEGNATADDSALMIHAATAPTKPITQKQTEQQQLRQRSMGIEKRQEDYYSRGYAVGHPPCSPASTVATRPVSAHSRPEVAESEKVTRPESTSKSSAVEERRRELMEILQVVKSVSDTTARTKKLNIDIEDSSFGGAQVVQHALSAPGGPKKDNILVDYSRLAAREDHESDEDPHMEIVVDQKYVSNSTNLSPLTAHSKNGATTPRFFGSKRSLSKESQGFFGNKRSQSKESEHVLVKKEDSQWSSTDDGESVFDDICSVMDLNIAADRKMSTFISLTSNGSSCGGTILAVIATNTGSSSGDFMNRLSTGGSRDCDRIPSSGVASQYSTPSVFRLPTMHRESTNTSSSISSGTNTWRGNTVGSSNSERESFLNKTASTGSTDFYLDEDALLEMYNKRHGTEWRRKSILDAIDLANTTQNNTKQNASAEPPSLMHLTVEQCESPLDEPKVQIRPDPSVMSFVTKLSSIQSGSADLQGLAEMITRGEIDTGCFQKDELELVVLDKKSNEINLVPLANFTESVQKLGTTTVVSRKSSKVENRTKKRRSSNTSKEDPLASHMNLDSIEECESVVDSPLHAREDSKKPPKKLEVLEDLPVKTKPPHHPLPPVSLTTTGPQIIKNESVAVLKKREEVVQHSRRGSLLTRFLGVGGKGNRRGSIDSAGIRFPVRGVESSGKASRRNSTMHYPNAHGPFVSGPLLAVKPMASNESTATASTRSGYSSSYYVTNASSMSSRAVSQAPSHNSRRGFRGVSKNSSRSNGSRWSSRRTSHSDFGSSRRHTQLINLEESFQYQRDESFLIGGGNTRKSFLHTIPDNDQVALFEAPEAFSPDANTWIKEEEVVPLHCDADAEEFAFAEYLIDVVQTHLCMRYQVRAGVKLFTSLLFLILPLILYSATRSNSQYYYFREVGRTYGDNYSGSEVVDYYQMLNITAAGSVANWSSVNCLVAVLLFFVADAVEIGYVFKVTVAQSVRLNTKITLMRDVFHSSQKLILVAVVLWTVYITVSVLREAWNPYDMGRLEKRVNYMIGETVNDLEERVFLQCVP